MRDDTLPRCRRDIGQMITRHMREMIEELFEAYDGEPMTPKNHFRVAHDLAAFSEGFKAFAAVYGVANLWPQFYDEDNAIEDDAVDIGDIDDLDLFEFQAGDTRADVGGWDVT